MRGVPVIMWYERQRVVAIEYLTHICLIKPSLSPSFLAQLGCMQLYCGTSRVWDGAAVNLRVLRARMRVL